MYAIVDIAGQQVKVEKGQKILVHRLDGEKGAKVDFDKVLLINNNDKTAIGSPVLEGAQVQATILDHLKGDKVFVFKKKRRKGYKKLNGHRQYLSLLEIGEILETGAQVKKETKKAPKKEEAKAKVEEPVKAAPAAEAKPEKATTTEAAVTETAKEEKTAPEAVAPEAETGEEETKPKKAGRKKKTEETEETPGA